LPERLKHPGDNDEDGDAQGKTTCHSGGGGAVRAAGARLRLDTTSLSLTRSMATRASNAGSDRHRSNCMLAAAGKATLPTARRRDLRTCVSWCSHRQRCRHTWS
jgi:hypothetical protein